MSESLLVQILLGIYLGILAGILPALVAWGLGFVFRYLTGVTVPGLGVVVVAAALAGISGGLMGLLDPAVSETPVGITALLVVLLLGFWAHNQGDRMGAEFPRRFTLAALRDRTLSGEALELGRFGQARIQVGGEVEDLPGYPPLPAETRRAIREDGWTFPADLPIDELEGRLTETLMRTYDLVDATVSIDREGRATVAAAPAPGALSRRIPAGRRAVSVRTLVPTGVARGDDVRLELPDGEVTGTVMSTTGSGDRDEHGSGTDTFADGGTGVEEAAPAAPTAVGGDGRLTVAVAARAAPRLLAADRVPVTVRSRGSQPEYDLISLLRGAGHRFRTVRLREGAPVVGRTVGEVGLRAEYGVAVLAIRRGGRRLLAPPGTTKFRGGDALIVAGPPRGLSAFEEAVA